MLFNHLYNNAFYSFKKDNFLLNWSQKDIYNDKNYSKNNIKIKSFNIKLTKEEKTAPPSKKKIFRKLKKLVGMLKKSYFLLIFKKSNEQNN